MAMKTSKGDFKIQLLSLLLIATTFIGISINGGDKGWIRVNGVFIDFIAGRWMSEYSLLAIFIVLSTIILYLMPLLMGSPYRYKVVIFVPSIYLVLTVISFPPLIILCIPFIVCWFILISAVRKREDIILSSEHQT